MSYDYNFDEQVSILMQKKIIKKRQTAVINLMLEIRSLLSVLNSCAKNLQLYTSIQNQKQMRELIIDINRLVYRTLEAIKELKRARAEIMRLKHD